EGKSVSSYVLKIKGYVKQLERLGYVLPQVLSVGLIMNGLTSDFVGFVRNYNMHNTGKKIGELHALLIEYEKEKGKGKGKGKDKHGYIPKPKNPKPSAKENPTKDDACHHCKEGLGGERKLKQGALYLYVGNGVRAQVEAIRSYDLVLPKQSLHNSPLSKPGGIEAIAHGDVGVRCGKWFGEVQVYGVVPWGRKVNRRFWRENVVMRVCYAHSQYGSTKKVDKTPYELWYGKVPNLSYSKVWRCETLVKRDTPNKLQQISVKCIFIGYPKETMGYYFYFPPKNKIVVARYIEFFEKKLISQEVSEREVKLKEIQDEDTSPSENTSKIPMEVEGFEPPQEEVIPVRMSARTHQAPNHLCLNVKVEEHSLGDLDEPTNYKAGMLDLESDKWLDDMNAEMQFMKDNQVWCLVDLPPNAKGFTQTFRVDYEETFSPVSDIRAIKILIAIAAFYDYEIWKMDVKTAFLNGYLDKDIYMVQPKDMFLVYGGSPEAELRVDCYCDVGFDTDRDDIKSQTGYVFVLNGGAVDYKSSKQSTTAMSGTEAEYIAAAEASMEAVWIMKFISGLGIVPTIKEPIKMFYNNSTALLIANEPGV
nr:retrotransposon protein, putative, Ty1-copia subclass [Tanacetum cinerariifolium]